MIGDVQKYKRLSSIANASLFSCYRMLMNVVQSTDSHSDLRKLFIGG